MKRSTSRTAAAKSKPTKPTAWEHPTGSGIRISELANKNAGKSYGVSYRVRIPGELLGKAGARETFQRKKRHEAERLAEDRFLALRQHGTSFADVPPEVQKQAVIAWGLLKPHGLDLIKTVEAGIAALRPPGGVKTLAEVLSELRQSKALRLAEKRLDQRTHDDFKSRSLKIETALGAKPINLITADEVSKWLHRIRREGADGSGALTQRSVLNYRNTLAETFRHAKARRYLTANPLEQFTREDYKSLGGESDERSLDSINILSVEEADKLLRKALETIESGLLPSLVLRLFCGLRTAEVCRLEWKEVHWLEENPYVHIPAGKAKKRRIRQVDIPANALTWLRLCNPPAEGLVVPGNGKVKGYCKRFARLAALAGVEWENNDSRHSFGSYHYALHGDAMKTAGQMGHKGNDNELFAHYRQLVRKEQAVAFFGLMAPAEASKVAQFPRAASAS
jgi:integrase